MWVKPDAVDSDYHNLIIKNNQGVFSYILQLTNSNIFIFGVGSAATGAPSATGSTTIPTVNKWYHVAGVYNGTYIAIYVNGNFERSTLYSGGVYQQPTIPVFIGSAVDSGFFNGTIDEVRIWNYPKSSAEIKAGYQAEIGKYYADFTHLSFGNYLYYAWTNV